MILRAGLLTILYVLAAGITSYAQLQRTPGAPTTLYNTPQRDTATNKTNTSEWRSFDAYTTYKYQQSAKVYQFDSSLHTFHRRPFTQPWYRDLGNLGSPVRNLYFTPEYRTGPTLGYHAFDIYRFHTDSLKYFNTTRPYTAFTFNLGSKQEQMAHILHTQNINPNWNVAVQYRKITSPGFYKNQRNNHDAAGLSTHYQSKDKRYELYGAFVYNKMQHDENGGIIDEDQLVDDRFSDRRTVNVAFQNDAYSATRSPVTNVLRDWGLQLNHRYTWGRRDTIYSEDSTNISYNLVPRFGISHKLLISNEKYTYKDLAPDSLRYVDFFNAPFGANDSVFMKQRWLKVENRFMLNGFLGKGEKQVSFAAGIGNRVDRFATEQAVASTQNNIVSNYIAAELKKERLEQGQWEYNADAQFYITGAAAGNVNIGANFGKDLKNIGSFTVGLRQAINNAPYNYTTFINQYDTLLNSFNKETVTHLYGSLFSERLKLSAGAGNYVISNFFYLSPDPAPSQFAGTFNVAQIWIRKVFRWRSVVLDNELAYQQPTGNAPVNVPTLMGRHQISIETFVFKNALEIATGIELRYHTPYEPAGYSPYFNRFFYQDAYTINNGYSASAFFNFRIKRFRAYIMGDQLQQFFVPNLMAAPNYAAQDAMLRFGFTWIMIN